MPVIINEVIAEVEPNTTPPEDTHTDEERLPLAAGEQEVADILALLEERRQRLRVD